ncbi:hypothetical protein SPYJRS4_1248 [Streptococcus pyogenes JRS4]|nr:hypothetical protein spyM18_1591 [Streptococcus pyogenes MGAS8232]BAR44748.1 hypothetical protein SPYJRS4_1248 [Streptococcus pyogenes JRS4]
MYHVRDKALQISFLLLKTALAKRILAAHDDCSISY